MKTFRIEKRIEGRPTMVGLPTFYFFLWVGVSAFFFMIFVFVMSFWSFVISAFGIGLTYITLKTIDSMNLINLIILEFSNLPDTLENDNPRYFNETE